MEEEEQYDTTSGQVVIPLGPESLTKKKTAGMRGIRDRYKIRDRNGFIVSVSTSYTRWLVVDESGPCIDAGKR